MPSTALTRPGSPDRNLLQVLTLGLGNATLVRSACSLLRQLANSDAIKAEIVDAGGLELLCRAVDAHTTHAGKTVTMCNGHCLLMSALLMVYAQSFHKAVMQLRTMLPSSSSHFQMWCLR